MSVQEKKKSKHLVPYFSADKCDQFFVLEFIITNFLGPDVKTDIPRRSASQRIAEYLPPYGLDDLGSSSVSLSKLESIYYYICRYAHQTVVLTPRVLSLYLEGDLPDSQLPEGTKQFTTFYPLDLHPQTTNEGSLKVLTGITLIDNPDVSHVAKSDYERFRMLTGLPDLEILMLTFELYHHDPWKIGRVQMMPQKKKFGNDTPQIGGPVENPWTSKGRKKRRFSAETSEDIYELSWQSIYDTLRVPESEGEGVAHAGNAGCTGSAKTSRGPAIGAVDIGYSGCAYIVQVLIPGVQIKRDQLYLDIQCDGSITLQGVTRTGETDVTFLTRGFTMTTMNFPPSGRFKISFKLPGPVAPELCVHCVRNDGIFEFIVSEALEKAPGAPVAPPAPKKRGRTPKKQEFAEAGPEAAGAPAPKKRGRKPRQQEFAEKVSGDPVAPAPPAPQKRGRKPKNQECVEGGPEVAPAQPAPKKRARKPKSQAVDS